MNAIKINPDTGMILDVVRHPHEVNNRNCFAETQDTDVKFVSDAEAANITNIGLTYSHEWDLLNDKLKINPIFNSFRLENILQDYVKDAGKIDLKTKEILARGYDFKDSQGTILAKLSLSLEAQNNLHSQVTFYIALGRAFPLDGIKISQRGGLPQYICPDIATLIKISDEVFPYVSSILESAVNIKNYINEKDANGNYVRTISEIINSDQRN